MHLVPQLVAELRRAHGVHTAILYGSRARGDATPESDIDVAGFAETSRVLRDARLWNGLFLDGFVYPTAMAQAAAPDVELLKLVGGQVILDDLGLAGPLLDALAAIDRQDPPPLAPDERQMRRVWARKMLARIQRGDPEAHYRRHWLLYSLLEDHHALLGRRYRGPKVAFAELALREPETMAAFERALVPDAPLEAIAALVALVVGESTPV